MSISFLQRIKTHELNSPKIYPLEVDVHAHILPYLDNGPETIEESIALIREMEAGGVAKIIATPHIMGEFYRNNADSIYRSRELVMQEVLRKGMSISIDVAAEYYVDIPLVAMLEQRLPLLTFGDEKYLLFETAILTMPSFLISAIENMKLNGMTPVMAHPERYRYLQQNTEWIRKLDEMGVLFQVNINSLKSPHQLTRELAEYLIKHKFASFLGSNAHNRKDWNSAREAMKSKYYTMAIENGLLNAKII